MTPIAGSPSLIRRASQRLLDNPGMIIWIALLFFTVLTWYTGTRHLGAWALPIALALVWVPILFEIVTGRGKEESAA